MKLFDRQKKQEINLYAYYDHAGIVRHLEDMARQGWQLEKAGSVFWTYRRCKPAELRYAVVYFSKASQFDPEPPAEQREFWELCKATGWELVTNRYQMQIFRNPAPDAIPIETDPVVQVENVRAAMKKAFCSRPGPVNGGRSCRSLVSSLSSPLTCRSCCWVLPSVRPPVWSFWSAFSATQYCY